MPLAAECAHQQNAHKAVCRAVSTRKELQARLRSVESIGLLARAMGRAAMALMPRARRRALDQERVYEASLRLAGSYLNACRAQPALLRHPLLGAPQTPPRLQKIGLILVASDRGLCGSMNADIWRVLERQIQTWRTQGTQTLRLSIIGAKGAALGRYARLEIADSYTHYGNHLDPLRALQVVRGSVVALGAGTLDALFIAYARSLNALHHRAVVEPLLPLSLLALPPTPLALPLTPKVQAVTLAEPDLGALRSPLLRHFIAAAIRHALAQTRAAEQCARTLAMQRAEHQANKLGEQLLSAQHRTRQAAITQAIAEAQAALE